MLLFALVLPHLGDYMSYDSIDMKTFAPNEKAFPMAESTDVEIYRGINITAVSAFQVGKRPCMYFHRLIGSTEIQHSLHLATATF